MIAHKAVLSLVSGVTIEFRASILHCVLSAGFSCERSDAKERIQYHYNDCQPDTNADQSPSYQHYIHQDSI
jgi:hypothetical protein